MRYQYRTERPSLSERRLRLRRHRDPRLRARKHLRRPCQLCTRQLRGPNFCPRNFGPSRIRASLDTLDGGLDPSGLLRLCYSDEDRLLHGSRDSADDASHELQRENWNRLFDLLRQ